MNYRDISASEFKELINVENTEILDVRAPEEEEEGTIDGAKRINLMDPSFRDEIKALDRSKTYLVYCRSGVRGASACDFMASVGFASCIIWMEEFMPGRASIHSQKEGSI